MCKTYTCLLSEQTITFTANGQVEDDTLSPGEFEQLISRRQRPKLSTTSKIANALFKRYALNDQLLELGGEPTATPLVICNRYANWDYVADVMSTDIATTLNGINNYVATAWFPATVQGYLTIEYGNTAEAVTLASRDPDFIAAAVDGLFCRDDNADRCGTVILATFECIPAHIAGQPLSGLRPAAFGAVSLIGAADSETDIVMAIATHQEMYSHVRA